jgi:hypothetical protein
MHMSMLGLDSEPTKDDNLFQRLFWPSNQPGEMDTLGQQGFWVCLIVGLISGVVSILTGHPVVGLLVAVFYWLGGIGVREHSVVAAVFVAVGYLLSVLAAVFTLRVPGMLDIICSGLLLANIRGTYIAAKWKKLGDPEAFPDRLDGSFSDWLVDQMPARVWPAGQFVFYVVRALYVLLLLLGAIGIMMISHRR